MTTKEIASTAIVVIVSIEAEDNQDSLRGIIRRNTKLFAFSLVPLVELRRRESFRDDDGTNNEAFPLERCFFILPIVSLWSYCIDFESRTNCGYTEHVLWITKNCDEGRNTRCSCRRRTRKFSSPFLLRILVTFCRFRWSLGLGQNYLQLTAKNHGNRLNIEIDPTL